MIFIFTGIFLTGSLTFCNSVITRNPIDSISPTHFVVLSEVQLEYFSGNQALSNQLVFIFAILIFFQIKQLYFLMFQFNWKFNKNL